MNILINCPLKFNLKSDKLGKFGGIESLNIALASKLANINFNVTLSSLCTKKTNLKSLINVPIKTIKLNKDKWKYDLVISSNDATIFKYFPDSKKILWLHNPLQIEKSIRKKQFVSLLKNKIKTVFVSSYLESITSKLFFFNKRIVIPNFLLPEFTNQKINYTRKKIFVWSVQRNRGLEETINIWIDKISPYYKDAELHIFGSNKFKLDFNNQLLKSKKIFFRGRVNKQALKKVYKKSLAMICLGYDETFCLNALEANSCGLPVITFGKTALNDFVVNNHNGFIVKNYIDLSSLIIRMININKSNHIRLIKNTVSISHKYLLKKIINNWLKVIK